MNLVMVLLKEFILNCRPRKSTSSFSTDLSIQLSSSKMDKLSSLMTVFSTNLIFLSINTKENMHQVRDPTQAYLQIKEGSQIISNNVVDASENSKGKSLRLTYHRTIFLVLSYLRKLILSPLKNNIIMSHWLKTNSPWTTSWNGMSIKWYSN